ncbi:hypothetical protein CASFOL_036464 [Castilleja foliolosa]|uniref:Uncharacterized protein n=1 Tax=Castilleja foliolosa TaxID=1961234 RepID=A0ABD3BW98_9LAMI
MDEKIYKKGDGISWYADGDKTLRHEYNLMTSYAFVICLLYAVRYLNVLFATHGLASLHTQVKNGNRWARYGPVSGWTKYSEEGNWIY